MESIAIPRLQTVPVDTCIARSDGQLEKEQELLLLADPEDDSLWSEIKKKG